MTEDEAKTKWCPFARVGVRNREWTGTSFNRTIFLDNDADNRDYPDQWPKCIGSACMAWRWTRQNHVEVPDNTFADDGTVIVPAHEALPLYKHAGTPVQDQGYCGLAGKP